MHGNPGPSAFSIKIDADTELRLHEERYAPSYFALIDQNRAYLREWMPWLDYEQSSETTALYIRGTLQQFTDNLGFQSGIWYQGQIVGSIGFHPINWNNRKVEIGYWIGAAFAGKGLVTKACRTLVTYAFDVYGLNKVEIHCATANKRSCAIPQRLGFSQEGILRQSEWLYDHFVDMAVYGMLAQDWQK
ncbi:MAG: GNAT family N-acetyltransferase [Ktedonobacteraceae bacterium]